MAKHPKKVWDFFIAHAGIDSNVAEALYDRLVPNFHVFLDSRSLLPGDEWDLALPNAQRNSLITVVLISSKTTKAYYQREEIAAAIALARNEEGHRVIPVFVDAKATKSDAVPYGLRLKHSISIESLGGLEAVAGLLTRSLSPILAMSEAQINTRYKKHTTVEIGIRLMPTDEFESSLMLGAPHKVYVFIGDYEEQRFRSLDKILANLLIGDSFEQLCSSNIRWSAIQFKVGKANYRKLDVLPATWKAAFRILSDPGRLGCFNSTLEEIEKMGRGHNRDYLTKDQDDWYHRLTIPDRRYLRDIPDSLLTEDLGISNLCFKGNGLTNGDIPSRIFFVKNVRASDLDSVVTPMGYPSDNKILM